MQTTASADATPPLPKHLGRRGTRAEGRRTRSLLLDAASRLFRADGLAAVSIADIAAAAAAFPSQVTYYFRTKEALFVEAACREVLYAAQAAEDAAGRQTSPHAYSRTLAETVLATGALGMFAEAMMLARRRSDLSPLIERTVARLHEEGARAYADVVRARNWRSQAPPEITARRFWTLAVGVTLEGLAIGRTGAALVDELMRLAGQQAEEPPIKAKRKTVR